MVELLRVAALFAATITTGLVAGLFYAYACSVMPGLSRTDDRTFVGTMQSINVAILNGWFAVCFLGAPVTTGVAAGLHLHREGRAALPWIAAAFVLYAATIAVTAAVSVPMNNVLDAAGEPGRIADLPAVRRDFEAGWVRWNLVRAVTSAAAFACLVRALL
ncbi:putative membrane protein [Streptosporangium becharense]|uniref:Putative membrane protein n=1 Tax=Streptosporangium becharense TaxID=1816182 RepID=A0A7W9MHK5_9ACTN|nr:anthrone oxygenase family protein [Streptosporangium becharense]MBB2915515.1 putative membrane protein [Streptosporangium becharense]MBB5821020.1 putative membrane protein [Streptosporangium becharense]